MMESKIQQQHLSKYAYIYLRQSSMGQVRFNQESTERQYALQNKAPQMGWTSREIKILDGDLGISGAHSDNREDFKSLVADVSMGKVGAVFALEASRLSRSCTDWHRLLELCAMTETLIIDEDGCYNPSDFNDQLLLGLKGTMSQAELHFIRARLQGGKLNKAKKGELKCPLPVGFYYDNNMIKFDADIQVRNALHLLFKVFRETGSAYGIVQYFGKNKILFPKRAYGGIWKGKLIWGSLNHERALRVLQNPCYAGVYVYGRYKYHKRLSGEGKIQSTTICLPMDAWPIMIKEHHEGYISWEDYLENQNIIAQNRTNQEENITPLAAREGMALLQGLLICGFCGRRLTVRYTGNGGIYPVYQCNWKKREGLDCKSCFSLGATLLDQAVTQKILIAIEPVQIEMATKAFEELEERNNALEKQWLMKIERARYEAQLAQRRYEDVDSSNRLVASTLEKNWNDTLVALESIQSDYGEYQKKNVLSSLFLHKKNIMSLAQDLPRLWNAASTSEKDKKRILRLLINDITVEKFKKEPKTLLHIRWQGGALESIVVELPQRTQDKWRHSSEIVMRVRELATTLTDQQIVDLFNQEGLITNKNNPYTLGSIQWIRFKHKIPSVLQLRKPDEFTIEEVAKKFNVSHYVVRYWIEQKIVNTRRLGLKFWVLIDSNTEEKLKNKAEQSTKILIAREKRQTKIAGGAL